MKLAGDVRETWHGFVGSLAADPWNEGVDVGTTGAVVGKVMMAATTKMLTRRIMMIVLAMMMMLTMTVLSLTTLAISVYAWERLERG